MPNKLTPLAAGANAQVLFNALAGNLNGLALRQGSVVLTGAKEAAGTFDSLVFSNDLKLNAPGILLTTGSADVARINDSTGFGRVNNLSGDAQLETVVKNVFSGNTATYDAAALSFTLDKLPTFGSKPKVLVLDIVFGSEEFPEYVNSFVDIAGVFVNGVNYAFFNNNSSLPLSVTAQNISAGSFLDNSEGEYAIQYDGISRVLQLYIPLSANANSFNVKIATADTGDYILDSGIFVSSMRVLDGNFDGLLTTVTPVPGTPVTTSPAPNTATYFQALPGGNAVFEGSLKPDVYDVGVGGITTIQGSLGQLNGDLVKGFDFLDILKIKNLLLNSGNIKIVQGSANITVTNPGNGEQADLKLEGDFAGKKFVLKTTDQGDTTLNLLDGTIGGQELVGGVLAATGAQLSSVFQNALSVRTNQALDSGASNIQMAVLLAAVSSIRETQGSSPVTSLQQLVGQLRSEYVPDAGGGQIIEVEPVGVAPMVFAPLDGLN